jgi:hypothetical protein
MYTLYSPIIENVKDKKLICGYFCENLNDSIPNTGMNILCRQLLHGQQVFPHHRPTLLLRRTSRLQHASLHSPEEFAPVSAPLPEKRASLSGTLSAHFDSNKTKSPDKNFPGALRLLRRIIGLKDDIYIRHICDKGILDLVVECFVANGSRYNLLNSSLIELFEFIRTVGLGKWLTVIIVLVCYNRRKRFVHSCSTPSRNIGRPHSPLWIMFAHFP